MTDEKRMEFLIDLWKTTVAVQQHFNDLELRIRNYAVTILVAVLGAVAFTIKEKMTVSLCGYQVQLGTLMLLAGCSGWVAFYMMDRFWYHRLLYGAVKHAQTIEEKLKTEFGLPEAGLTEAIGRESPISFLGWEIHTPRKMDIFYLLGLLLLCISAAIVQLAATAPPA